MEVIIGAAASVVTTIITVLGAMLYLDRKIEANRREHSGEIKDVRKASEDAHKEINSKLGDIQIVQAAHTERFKCIESHLNVSRPDD